MGLIIAIDGPAASGKGTLARKLAKRFNLVHLDTGLLYRAIAARLLATDTPLDDHDAAKKQALSLDLATLERDTLSHHHIGEAASRIALLQGVRQALVDVQRNFAMQEPGAVLDGRDIGTVICPDANVKLFVTANLEERARRRYQEAIGRGARVSFEDVLADISTRDKRDQERNFAPLQTAANAHLIDTSKMDIEEAFLLACSYVTSVMPPVCRNKCKENL